MNGMPRLELANQVALGGGTMRRVYLHPERADSLVKVIRADMLEQRWGGWRNWLKRRARARHFTVYMRELHEYVALRARHPDAAPIARVYGLVETDLGLGLVVERFQASDGRLAPTLLDLCQEHGLAVWILQGIQDLFRELADCHVVLSDTTPTNIVYGSSHGEPPRFVVVDGFGEKNVVPLCSMSPAYNRRRLGQLYRRMLGKLPA